MSIINYAGVAQSSILGPLLFNIFINHVLSFLTTCEMCNYPDDNTLYTYPRNLHQVQEYWKNISKYQTTDSMTMIWSSVLVTVNSEALQKPMKIRYLRIMKSDLKKLLLRNWSVLQQTSISISTNIKQMYASRKLNALSKMPSLFSCQQKKKVANSCISGRFNYCSLISMFSSKIKKLHQSSVHLCYNEIIPTKYSAAND